MVAMALAVLVLGGGAGVVTTTAASQSTLTVKIDGPIKAELPPHQEALLKDNASAASALERLDARFAEFALQYREDQAERRRMDDVTRAAMADMAQRLGIVERETHSVGGAVKEQEKRLRMLELQPAGITP
jgi:hypothetical protein